MTQRLSLEFVLLLQLQDLEQQLSCGVQPNSDIKAELLQRDVAKLTFEEGRMVLFQSAKATIGASKVQQICEAMVQLFFFKSKVATCASLSLFEDFAPVKFVPDHCDGQHVLILQIPNIDSKDLRTILSSYMSLFKWEMSMRGFEVSATYWRSNIHYWELEHL